MTTVSCTASDAHSNVASGSFTVTVEDTTAPGLSGFPADQTVEATGASGAVATYSTPTAEDLVDGALLVSCTPTSGSTFELGATTVDCTVTDAHGNASTASFTVTVEDTTAPVLTVPTDIAVDAVGPEGVAVMFAASASDVVDPSPAVTCTPSSGATFDIGSTTVQCTASDAAGNTSSDSFEVHVRGAAEQAEALAAAVEDVGPGKSLSSKVSTLRAQIDADDGAGACETIVSLLGEVSAQSGKQIASGQADAIVARAEQIGDILGCG
jgi:hypothetical protein